MPSPLDAALYYARKRTRSFRAVVSSLFKTHDFAVGATSIDTGASFGGAAARTEPVTFQFELKRTDQTASGTILRLGSAARQVIVTILSNTGLRVVAGPSGDDQVTVDATSVLDHRLLASGTAQPGGGDDEIILAAAEDARDDIFNGARAVITGGTGSGQSRLITDYDGGTVTATVASDWTTNPDATSTYEIQLDLTHDFTVSVEPAAGRVSIWRAGELVAADEAANGDFDGAWCDDDATGLVGGSLTTADMTPLEVFQKQLPQRRRT